MSKHFNLVVLSDTVKLRIGRKLILSIAHLQVRLVRYMLFLEKVKVKYLLFIYGALLLSIFLCYCMTCRFIIYSCLHACVAFIIVDNYFFCI